MTTNNILTQQSNTVKTTPVILRMCIFDRQGRWTLEVIFKGGMKVTGPVTPDEITAIQADLEVKGWQVDQSLFHRGFNAKPKPDNGLGRWWAMRADAKAIANEPLDYDGEELIFASSADLWPDDLGLAEVTL